MEKIKNFNSSDLFFEGCISFISEIGEEENLYHRCYKIVISLDNCFECLIDGQRLSGLRGLIVNQSVSHTLYSQGATVLVNFFETDSFRGWQLRALLKDQACCDMETILSSDQLKNVMPANYKNLSDETLLSSVRNLMENIFISPPLYNSLFHKPMQLALELIDQNLDSPLEADEIAEKVNMTTESFRYVFVQYMSIPFAQYVSWKRIRRTMAAAASTRSGSNLYFVLPGQRNSNKVFNRIFGLCPTTLINNSRVLV